MKIQEAIDAVNATQKKLIEVIKDELEQTKDKTMTLEDCKYPCFSEDGSTIVNTFVRVSLVGDDLFVDFEDYYGQYKMTAEHFTVDELTEIVTSMV